MSQVSHVAGALPFMSQVQNINSPFLASNVSYNSGGEKAVKLSGTFILDDHVFNPYEEGGGGGGREWYK